MSIIYTISLFILIIGLAIFFLFRRNYFNKHKYIRLVRYNEDKSVDVSYIKRDIFNKDNQILINPEHVFNLNGYNSIMITSKSNESINPLDFNSKYDAKKYQTAIQSKVVKDLFTTLQPNRLDPLKILMVLGALNLLAVAYLLYSVMGG